MNKNNLLPIGFYDLVFKEAESLHKKINIAIEDFTNSGYGLIKTPLIEFAANYSAQDISRSFTLSDSISSEILVLRNDITLQISRLLATRLKSYELPIKICYVGDVLLKKSSELYEDRQSTQLGLEIIGADNDSCLLVMTDIINLLKKISTSKFIIEISFPNFINLLCRELKIEIDDEFIDLVKKKNISYIKKYLGNYHELFSDLILKNNNFDNIEAKIKNVAPSAESLILLIEKYVRIKDILKNKFSEFDICCDFMSGDENSYHQDISFSIFCEDFSYPIARAGYYEINGNKAFGATIYMNYLCKVEGKVLR